MLEGCFAKGAFVNCLSQGKRKWRSIYGSGKRKWREPRSEFTITTPFDPCESPDYAMILGLSRLQTSLF